MHRSFAVTKVLSLSLSLSSARDNFCQDSGKIMAKVKHRTLILLSMVSCLFTVELEVFLESLQMTGRRTLCASPRDREEGPKNITKQAPYLLTYLLLNINVKKE